MILIAGLSKVLEAVADLQGTLAGVVSTWVATPEDTSQASLRFWEALLNAPVLSLVYAVRYRGKELSGGNITIGKRELAALPVPADLGGLPSAVAEPVETVAEVFGLDPHRPSHRVRLAATAIGAVQRRGWAAPDTSEDCLASAAIGRLYGLDHETHSLIQTWFDARCTRSRR